MTPRKRWLTQSLTDNPKRWIVVSLIVMLGAMITRGNFAAGGDAAHYLVIAESVAFDGDFDLGNNYNDASRIINESPDEHARLGKDHILRPVHDVGLPVIAAPWFAVAYRLAEVSDHIPAAIMHRLKLDRFIALRQLMAIFMIAVTAVLAITFFDFSNRLIGRPDLACMWTLLWALSPPVLSHGYVFFTEILSATLALLVVAKLDVLQNHGRSSHAFVFALITAALLLVHVRNIGMVAAITFLLSKRANRRQRFAIGLAVLAIIGVKLGLNWRFWGTLITTPHQRLGTPSSIQSVLSESLLRGFALLFDARHGLLPSAPIYLLVLPAFVSLWRRNRELAGELMLIVACYLLPVLLPITNDHGWRGGWSPPARFLVPIIPFLGLAISVLWASQYSRLVTRIIIGCQIVLDAIFWAQPKLLWTEGPGPAPFVQSIAGTALAEKLPLWETWTTAGVLEGVAGISLMILLSVAAVSRMTERRQQLA